jgi:hypothetical protein
LKVDIKEEQDLRHLHGDVESLDEIEGVVTGQAGEIKILRGRKSRTTNPRPES